MARHPATLWTSTLRQGSPPPRPCRFGPPKPSAPTGSHGTRRRWKAPCHARPPPWSCLSTAASGLRAPSGTTPRWPRGCARPAASCACWSTPSTLPQAQTAWCACMYHCCAPLYSHPVAVPWPVGTRSMSTWPHDVPGLLADDLGVAFRTRAAGITTGTGAFPL